MRPDPFRPATWPLALKVPVQTALFTFLVALVTTQTALTFSSERERRILEESLGTVAAAVSGRLHGASPLSPEAAGAILAAFTAGLDRTLVERVDVAWAGPDGTRQIASAGPAPDAADVAGPSVTRTFGGASPDGGLTVTVSADADALAAARLSDQLRVAAVDLALALLGALVALWFVRWTLAPVEIITADLVAENRGSRAFSAPMAPISTEFGRLQRLMKERIAAEEERASALVRLAEQERTAGLAKLAASMAHEVRNPLAGLMNAVSTLRRFGDDPSVRGEGLDLIERGLRSIDRVTGAALATYRPAVDGAGFGPSDLADLEVLATPEARQRGVSLDWDVGIDTPVPVDAALLRQVVLNLLLNAVKASGEGGRTALSARLSDGELVVCVTDTGPGLPKDVRRFLAGGEADPFPRPGALGLWTVMRLLDDIDGRLAIDTHPGKGTTVTIHAPLAGEMPQAREAATHVGDRPA